MENTSESGSADETPAKKAPSRATPARKTTTTRKPATPRKPAAAAKKPAAPRKPTAGARKPTTSADEPVEAASNTVTEAAESAEVDLVADSDDDLGVVFTVPTLTVPTITVGGSKAAPKVSATEAAVADPVGAESDDAAPAPEAASAETETTPRSTPRESRATPARRTTTAKPVEETAPKPRPSSPRTTAASKAAAAGKPTTGAKSTSSRTPRASPPKTTAKPPVARTTAARKTAAKKSVVETELVDSAELAETPEAVEATGESPAAVASATEAESSVGDAPETEANATESEPDPASEATEPDTAQPDTAEPDAADPETTKSEPESAGPEKAGADSAADSESAAASAVVAPARTPSPKTRAPRKSAPKRAPAKSAAVLAAESNLPDAVDGKDQPETSTEQSTDAVATRPESSDTVLRVTGLSKKFSGAVAVDSINLEIKAGEFYGIVGPNGAGKTTTLSMITGLLRPDSGTITVHGADVWANPVVAKRNMGVLPDRLRLFDRLTGVQMLYYAGVLRGLDRATAQSRSRDLAAAFGLDDALGRLVADYSAGMTKKIALAAAMIHSPRLLVLDEPFESVDPVSEATVTGILKKYTAAGGTVLMSSHSMELVERICDSVAVVIGGKILADGTLAEVQAGGTLEARFRELAGGETEVGGLEWLHSFSD